VRVEGPLIIDRVGGGRNTGKRQFASGWAKSRSVLLSTATGQSGGRNWCWVFELFILNARPVYRSLSVARRATRDESAGHPAGRGQLWTPTKERQARKREPQAFDSLSSFRATALPGKASRRPPVRLVRQRRTVQQPTTAASAPALGEGASRQSRRGLFLLNVGHLITRRPGPIMNTEQRKTHTEKRTPKSWEFAEKIGTLPPFGRD